MDNLAFSATCDRGVQFGPGSTSVKRSMVTVPRAALELFPAAGLEHWSWLHSPSAWPSGAPGDSLSCPVTFNTLPFC